MTKRSLLHLIQAQGRNEFQGHADIRTNMKSGSGLTDLRARAFQKFKYRYP